MNHVFASSHLPEDNRSEDEEDEEDIQPMLRAGGVRAFSHLRQPAQGEPAAPRPTAPAYIPAWITEALRAEPKPGLETGPGSHGDFASDAIAHGGGVTGMHGVRNPLTLLNSRPFDPRGGMLPEHVEQQQQQSGDQGRFSGYSRSGSPALPSADTPPEPSTRGPADGQRGDSWGDRPPPTRPDSSTATTGRGFDGRGTPEAFDPEQGLGAMPPRPGRGSSPSSPQQGMQRFQAAAPVQQKPGGMSPTSQAPKQGQPPAPQNAADVKKSPPTDPISPAPKTTIRIGNYPAYEKLNAPQAEIDEWNKTFRDTYGKLAADAAKKQGVPARLLAALSANEVAAPNWNALNAFADRNTLLTKSVGPLQISSKTALKYKLIPIDNEFYGASQADRWTALHDPDVRYGQPSPPTGLTPGQRLSQYSDSPYPNRHGPQIIHNYLDNPATSFDAGAKLLKVYLQRLADDYKSGAYLNYSKDFRDLNGFSLPNDPIHKDLSTLTSGDKDAIYNLRFSPGLARALAMMWNNGEDIVHVKDILNQSPNAHAHASNMQDQQVNQDDLIPRD
jgi:hypothetical protein